MEWSDVKIKLVLNNRTDLVEEGAIYFRTLVKLW